MKRWNRPHCLSSLFYVCLAIAVAMLTPCALTAQEQTTEIAHTGSLPITSKSPEARRLFDVGLVKLENLHGPDAMQDFRHAVQMDPDFAMANIMISFNSVDPTVDPAEQVAARTRANAARSKISAGERLVIDWLTNSSEGKMVAAI